MTAFAIIDQCILCKRHVRRPAKREAICSPCRIGRLIAKEPDPTGRAPLCCDDKSADALNNSKERGT